MINLVKKIILALIIGLFSTIIIIQNQTDFKTIIQDKIEKTLSESLGCCFKCNIKSLNLFFPSVELENVYVHQEGNEQWHWNCKNLRFNCSWLDFFLHGKFYANITINKIELYSLSNNGNLDISPHIKKLILSNNPSVPVDVISIKLNKSKFNIIDNELNIKSLFNFNCEIRNAKELTKIIIYLTDSLINKNKNVLVNNASGSIKINILKTQNNKFLLEIDGLCNLPTLNVKEDRCYFSGQWGNDKKFIKISTIDDKLSFDCINISSQENNLKFDLNFHASIKYLLRMFNFSVNAIDGDCDLNIIADGKSNAFKCHGFVKNFVHNDKLLNLFDIVEFNLDKKNEGFHGNFDALKNKESRFTGICKFDDKKQKLFFSFLSNDKTIDSAGEITISNSIKGRGNINKQSFEFEFTLKPKLLVKNISYLNEENKECISLDSILNEDTSIDNLYKLRINIDHIKGWLPEIIKQNVVGKGEIIVEGKFSDNNFKGKIISNYLNISIPKIYNLIENVDGLIDIDFLKKEILINKANIKMHKGIVECNNVKLKFENNNLSFLYIPLSIKNNLITWGKDIIALISGKILIKKMLNTIPEVNGFLLVESAQVRNNILSEEFRNELISNYNLTNNNNSDVKLNVSLISDDTIKIKTPFINTKIKLDLKINNTIANPNIVGSIDLVKGTITFPYKKLNITSGNINFLPEQTYDPIINLTAKNRIRKFNIIMHVTGSAQDHNISFESSPSLTDEQIMALLLVGSENGSINIIMPSIILKNVKNIILGSSQTHTNTKKYFDTLLKPLKYIKIVPNFNSETGRPGFKGSIKISNDRLNAELQKNFTLAEDTRFEIDYSITDEISIKATKDERGDLGGELEMRWKF